MDINSDFDIILLASYYFHIILWVIKFRETSYVLFQGSVRLMLPESDFFDMTFNAPKPKIVGQLAVRNKKNFPIKELAGNGFNKMSTDSLLTISFLPKFSSSITTATRYITRMSCTAYKTTTATHYSVST